MQIAKILYEQKCPTPREYKKNIVNPSCIWGSSVISHVLSLTQIHATLSTAQSANRERKKIAEKVAAENTLTRPLVDLLIEKVLIYPKEKFEVAWKVKNFFADCRD